MIYEILTAVIFIALLLLCYLVYSGLLTSIEVKVATPPITSGNFFYKFYQQNYRKSGEAFRGLEKLPIKDKILIGIYYDDPAVTPKDKTRSAIGIFIPDEKNCDELKETMQAVGFSHVHLPEVQKAVLSVFPHRTMFSILIAIARVYPRVKKFVMDKKLQAHPCMEVYQDSKMYFVSPLEESDKFYVDEYKSSSL